MAKILGVFTNWKGKVGNMTFCTWKGIQVAKNRSFPSNPQTSAQTVNRDLFANLVECFQKLVSTVIVYYWNNFATSRQTGWGNIMGHNQALQAGSAFDPDDIVISQGSLPGEDITTGVYAGTTAEAEWVESTQVGAGSTDSVMGYVFDSGTGKWYASSSPAAREDEAITIDCESGLTVGDLKIFLVFFTGTLGVGTVVSCSDSSFFQATAS